MLWVTRLEPVDGELVDAESASEKATAIARWLNLYEPEITKRCRSEFHDQLPAAARLGEA